MFSFRWQDLVRPSRRQITAILLLVLSVAALLPIPLISSPAKNGKDRSRPFPCQDRPCGCRSAEQCKKMCCCFSAAQKLAWAKRHGVDAAEVVATADKCKPNEMARKACCSSHVAKTRREGRSQKSATKTASRYKVVIGVIAQECQGNAQTPFGQSIYLIPPIISLESFIEPTIERFILSGLRFEQPTAEPPVPPPRLIAA